MRLERARCTLFASHGAVVALEFRVNALAVEPSSQLVCFWNVRLHAHGGGADHAQGAATKVTDPDAAEGNDRMIRSREGLGLFAPKCETNGEVGAVYEGELSLGDIALSGFRGDVAQLAALFDDSNHVAHLVLLNGGDVVELDKVISDGWKVAGVLAL